uniref:Uncharacterized protein n=1 Tax=Anguilla anguilla TaxID=7936 RepID=A0A0E9WW92_ANGAN
MKLYSCQLIATQKQTLTFYFFMQLFHLLFSIDALFCGSYIDILQPLTSIISV